MVERHYDDEALISLLEATRVDPVETDPHLRICGECRETLGVLRSLSVTMKDDDVWDRAEEGADAPVAETIVTLRVFADGMAHEDTIAEGLLRELLAGDRNTWAPRLQEHPEYRTAGMVRRLLAAADRAIDTMPPDALVLTALAAEVAEGLAPSRYPSDTVAKLRGAAWRDRAYALYYTGSFSEAERAVLAAERHLSDCVVGEWDLARVHLLHAMALRAVGSLSTARQRTASARHTFSKYGDTARTVNANSVEAALAYKIGDVRAALKLWLTLEQQMGQDTAADSVARLLPNIGMCYRDLGEFEKAMQYFDLAAAIWEDLSAPAEAARVRWNTASLYARSGRHVEAVEQLLRVRRDFELAGMASEAALVALEAAEMLVARGDMVMVTELCRIARAHFSGNGLEYSEPARIALAYLQEAAGAGTATPSLVSHVRSYIRKLPEQPQLLFAPPPA